MKAATDSVTATAKGGGGEEREPIPGDDIESLKEIIHELREMPFTPNFR